jgi:hypothetical protein
LRRILFGLALSALDWVASAAAADSVLLASRRAGAVEAIDPDTLETVFRIQIPTMTESVTSDPYGQRLFLRANRGPETGCCALFALDLQSMRLSFLIEPAQFVMAAGPRLFTQRGNVGIEVFDPRSLDRLPTAKAPGVYRLSASPDGRLVFGISNFPKPSLDLFDAVQGMLISSHALPDKSSLAGAWLGRQYFLLTVESAQARLWAVNSDGEPARAVSLDGIPGCDQSPYDIVASGNRLVIYSRFGLKLDGCATAAGFVVTDPLTGAVTDRLAANLRFRQMVAGSDGRYLYGLDVGSPAWRQVRIVKIDAATGQILAEKNLDSDVWYLTAGAIPHESQGNLNLTAIP